MHLRRLARGRLLIKRECAVSGTCIQDAPRAFRKKARAFKTRIQDKIARIQRAFRTKKRAFRTHRAHSGQNASTKSGSKGGIWKIQSIHYS